MNLISSFDVDGRTVALALAAAILPAALWLAWRRPVPALALALASLAIRPELLWGGPHIGYEWGLHQTLLVAVLIASALRFGLRQSINWPILALLAVLGLNLLFGELHRGLTLGLMLEGLALFALPFAVSQVVPAAASRRVVALVIALTPLLSVAIGAFLQLADLRTTFADLNDRLEGATGNAAVFAVLAFGGVAVAMHESARQSRPWIMVLAAVNLVLVVLSGTRMAILATAVLLGAYALASRQFRQQLWRGLPVTLFSISLVAMAGALYAPTAYRRFLSGLDRSDVWQFFYGEFLLSPFFGRGIGSAFVAGVDWPDFLEKPFLPIPHNEYLHLLVIGGIVGFALCMAAIILWYYQMLQTVSLDDRRFLIALAPAIAMYSITDNTLVYSSALGIYTYLGVIGRSAVSSCSMSSDEPAVHAPRANVVARSKVQGHGSDDQRSGLLLPKASYSRRGQYLARRHAWRERIVGKLKRLGVGLLIAGACIFCIAAVGDAASLATGPCALSDRGCAARVHGPALSHARTTVSAAHDDRTATATSPGVVRGDELCDQPATEPAAVPEHLRELTASVATVEGPLGITVDFVAYPLPPYEGNPWSHWGEGLVASNGRYYSAIGDHLGMDGNSYLYEYDPGTRILRAVGDVLGAYGAHRRGQWGYGKIHGQISEGPCRQLYFHTYWGTRRGIEYSDSYTGDLLMRYDPIAGQLKSMGVQMLEMGSPSTRMWPAGGLFYGEANHPAGKGRAWPEGKRFWVYDVAEAKVVFRSPKLIDDDSGRDIAVDHKGRAYYSGGGREILRYDPSTGTETRIALFPNEGKLRASSEPAPDGKIFMTTNSRQGHHAYLFDPADAALTPLASLVGDTADLAISVSGEVSYFTPGAHGQGRDLGFPLMEIDRSGTVRTIVELGPIINAAGGPYPAGTYSYSVDPDNPGDIYILANAGPRGTDDKFGQPLMIVVHLAASERR